MTLDRYFRFSSYALIATGFLMLVATHQLDWLSVTLFGGVLIYSWFVDAGRVQWRLSPTLVSVLMLIFLPFPFIDWLVLKTSPIVALIHFIFFAAAMKLAQPKRQRDWLWLYVVAFFQMLLAAGMMIDTTFFVLLLLFLFSAVSTLVSFEMRRAQHSLTANSRNEETGELEFWRETTNARKTLSPPRARSLVWFSAASLIIILLLATPLFLAMPRLALRNSGAGWMQGASLSGFSDSVRLGEVGQLKLNPQLVMRVRVNQPPDQYRSSLRWRGITLDFYDGGSWRDSLSWRGTRRLGARPVTRRGGTYWVNEAASLSYTQTAPALTQQTFYLEPLDTPTIFAAPQPMFVEGVPSLWRDESDGLWTSNHALNRLVYRVESDTRRPSDKELREDNAREYTQALRLRYTQLPKNFDPRIGQLAASVTKGTTTTFDMARWIEQHLREQYSYSLNLQRTDDGEPVADFLFNVQAGHCEYFASAMTLMLRTQGIPARIVNGFQMGEYSEISDFYTVRQSDAHSWVEVYFPKYGWVAFDPTPSAGLNQYENNWLATVRHFGESLEMFWLESVIGFGANEQASLVFRLHRTISQYQAELSTSLAEWRLGFSDLLEAMRTDLSPQNASAWGRAIFTHPLILLLFALGLVLGGLVLWRKQTRSWQRRIKHEPTASAIAFYQEMVESLARAGHQRLPEQTPQEFAASVSLPGVSAITNLYQQVRFGGKSLSEAEIQQIELALKELRTLERSKHNLSLS
jgi:protein-glutamine gamma-glutamyltransferase